jgi:DNA-binding PadR family transcriptional regulator
MSDRAKRAKFYRLTPAGRKALRLESEDWERYVEAVARVFQSVPAGAST